MKPAHAALLVILVTGLVVPVSVPATAQTGAEDITFVESGVEADTTWAAEDGPYRVTRDITIAPDATLTLSPGTEVQLAEGVTITVEGSLVAAGTEARPVSVRMTPGAPAGVRWNSFRYAGESDSRLTLRNATVRGGTNAITVASERGRVSVLDSTLRNHSESALRVAEVGETPPITVRESSVRDIDGHALRVTPGFGAVGEVRVGAAPDRPANRSVHTLSVVPGTPMTTDEIRIDYGDHGDLADAGLRALTVDADGDPKPERKLTSLVSSVERRDNALLLRLEREVSLAGDSRLALEYDGVLNPDTRGVYPVAVAFERDNVSQLPGDVAAPLSVGGVSEKYVELRPDGPTRVSSLTVAGSSFADVNGTAVFVAADRVTGTSVPDNRISSVAGAGVSVQARQFDAELRENDVSARHAGIALAHRNAATLVATGNRITDSETGIRIRQSGASSPVDLEPTLRNNVLSGNERYGVSVRGEQAALARFRLANNAVTDNGRDGVLLEARTVADGALVENRIGGNGGDGLRFDARSLRNATVADNVLTDNGGDGIEVSTRYSARNLDVVDNRVQNGGGHGVAVRTGLVVHRAHVEDNRLANGAGAGVLVASPVTHGGVLNVTNNTVAANAYGVLITGALRASLARNDIVFNTNEHVTPVSVPDVEPGTGVWVAEGPAGAVLRRGDATESVSELIADPNVDAQLSRVVVNGDTAVILRTDREGAVRMGYPGALSVGGVSGEIPTGIALSADETKPGVDLHGNDIYGQPRGLVVDVETLVDASTSARVVVDQLRTVHAGQNYWGASSGPYHTSILPSGDGNPVVTERGWVDFVPFAAERLGPSYTRPVARLDAPTSAVPNETVTASGAESTSERLPVAFYHFTVGAEESARQSSSSASFTMPNESVTVRLAVENSLGIDSAESATATVAPSDSSASGSESGSASPGTDANATTAAGESEAPASPTTGGMSLLGGLLGAIPAIAGFGLGMYGVSLSLKRRDPPVSGLAVQGLVIVGVLVWMMAGLLTDPFLLRLGVGAALVWMSLTVAAFLLLKYR